MTGESYVIHDDVREAEEAARHAGLVEVRQDGEGTWLRFNNGQSILVRGEGIQMLEVHPWRP